MEQFRSVLFVACPPVHPLPPQFGRRPWVTGHASSVLSAGFVAGCDTQMLRPFQERCDRPFRDTFVTSHMCPSLLLGLLAIFQFALSEAPTIGEQSVAL